MDTDVRKSAAKVLEMIFSAHEFGATRNTLTEILVDWAAPWASAKPDARKTCPQCGEAFMAAQYVGKRITAVYCSNKCRVAAQRARKAAAMPQEKHQLSEPMSCQPSWYQEEKSPWPPIS